MDPLTRDYMEKLELYTLANMFRLNEDGTVDKCDDTPDYHYRGPKYARSTMRKGMWVILHNTPSEKDKREYIEDHLVPEVIKMFDLLEQ